MDINIHEVTKVQIGKVELNYFQADPSVKVEKGFETQTLLIKTDKGEKITIILFGKEKGDLKNLSMNEFYPIWGK